MTPEASFKMIQQLIAEGWQVELLKEEEPYGMFELRAFKHPPVRGAKKYGSRQPDLYYAIYELFKTIQQL